MQSNEEEYVPFIRKVNPGLANVMYSISDSFLHF